MNPSSFTGSSTTEDPENFVEKLNKVFEVMHVVESKRVELAALLLKSVDGTWFDQWKDGKGEDAPQPSWACFEEAFLGRFFPQEQKEAKGSVAQGGSKPPACAKCGRNHSGICSEGSTVCFKCGQTEYFMKKCPKNKQGGGNGSNGAQTSSAAPPDRATPRGATFGTGGGSNHLYAITSRQDQVISLDVVTGIIKVSSFMFMLC
ncbi:uncharacterized protein LOC107030255 [Solanum pennellii]|uniref:Uncharacterized protein LOC107030255 n=1 Tax=Solanum pennellii TaxID=28526 RepID=A0ABM1HL47_SOLPN|nr:uncharacterized protein LOC107030255 [Solanum pennellii]